MIKIKKRLLSIYSIGFVSIIIILTSASRPKNDSDCCRYYPGQSWERIKDIKAGWYPEKLETAHKFAEKLNMGGVLVLYKGKILVDWGDTKRKMKTHSVRKSFMSALYGPAVQKGMINLSATMEDLGIDDIPPLLTKEEKQATVQMLLEARSGVYHPCAFETKGMAAKRPKRYSHAPGTFWYYNNWDFNVLGAIYKKETGEGVFEAFKKIIADPIGMEDFNPKTDGRYVYEREKSEYPAYPFKISTRNMARFGLLMARNGQWKDQQIIPEFWIKQSTVAHSDNSPRGGYGYLWWVSVNGQSRFKHVSLPYGQFSAMGHKGHVITMIPDKEMVFVYNNDDRSGETPYEDIGKLWGMILDAERI